MWPIKYTEGSTPGQKRKKQSDKDIDKKKKYEDTRMEMRASLKERVMVKARARVNSLRVRMIQ